MICVGSLYSVSQLVQKEKTHYTRWMVFNKGLSILKSIREFERLKKKLASMYENYKCHITTQNTWGIFIESDVHICSVPRVIILNSQVQDHWTT